MTHAEREREREREREGERERVTERERETELTDEEHTSSPAFPALHLAFRCTISHIHAMTHGYVSLPRSKASAPNGCAARRSTEWILKILEVLPVLQKGCGHARTRYSGLALDLPVLQQVNMLSTFPTCVPLYPGPLLTDTWGGGLNWPPWDGQPTHPPTHPQTQGASQSLVYCQRSP